MITPKIKTLFQFIEYLHSNIENFKQHDEVLKEFYLLHRKRKQFSPQKNFKDKLKYDELTAEIKDKHKVIQENLLQPILTKATELNICDPDEMESVWNRNSTEVYQLKENFSKDDLPEIFSHRSKYIECREGAFFKISPFFYELDELLMKLFDWFKETDYNEFEAFETKATPVVLFSHTHSQKQKNDFLPPQQSKKEDLSENTEPNNLTISTIEDWLYEFKERNILTEPHYTNLANALTHYFENGAFPKLEQTIKVSRVNKKLLGWHLNRIFHAEGKGVEIDLLNFAKASISTFKDVEFDEKDLQKSNLYKYFTTKTK